jgi:DNA-binding MarR family transcriptional regulator
MAKYDLNSAHAFYLATLIQYPQGVTAAKLSELCCKNKADVSRMISILEKKGLVRREAVGGKLYRAKLLLTEEGRQAATHVQGRAALAVELAGSGMTETDRETFYRCLEQITAKLGIPPFLLGFSWSTTERMSVQQADILTSELEYYRSVLEPVLRRIVRTHLLLCGCRDRFWIEWEDINLQDAVVMSTARLNNAQAAKLEREIGWEDENEG